MLVMRKLMSRPRSWRKGPNRTSRGRWTAFPDQIRMGHVEFGHDILARSKEPGLENVEDR